MCQVCEQIQPLQIDLYDTVRAKPLAKALRSLFTKRALFVAAVKLATPKSEILSHMMLACFSEGTVCEDQSIRLEILSDCGHQGGCCRRFIFTKFQNAYLTVTSANGDELLVDDYYIPAFA
jgi:hypothetical protein